MVQAWTDSVSDFTSVVFGGKMSRRVKKPSCEP